MSRKLVSFELTTKEDMYYSILKTIGKEIYDKPDHWPVEAYDDGGHKIIFETVEALIDDVLEFAGILQKYLLQAIESTEPKKEFAYLFKKESLQFVIEGTAEYTSSGENCRFRIELNDGSLTIQESENYIFFGSMYFANYEAFSATKTILCDDFSKLCSKDEFDGDCEYCVTHDKLYADEFPPYGKKIFADKYMKAGAVYSVDDIVDKEPDIIEEINEADAVLAFGFNEGLKVEGVGYSISIPDGFQFQQNMEVTDSMATTTRDFVAWSPRELEPDQWSEADVAILSAVQVTSETVLLNPVEWFDRIKESLSFLGEATGSEVYSKSFSNDNVCGGYAVQRISDDCVNYHCVVGENQNAHQFRIIINKSYSQQSMDTAVELWLRTMKCKSDSRIKIEAACEKKLEKNESEDKKERLSKLEEHRIKRENEENHVKEIIFSIITGDKKKTVAELQKENRELSGMSVQRIAGYLRRFVTSGELECMGNIYYMLPETAERIRTKEKKRQEEQQRQEEEKKKQEKEARSEYERVKDSIKQAKAEKKQTEAGIEKVQAEISEIEMELEKQSKKMLFKDKSLIAKLNTDLLEKRAKLKEVQGIKEQNIKALRTLEEELQSKYAPFVQEDEEKNKKEFAAKYPKIADFFRFEIEKKKSLVKQLLYIMKQNEQKEWNINDLHNAIGLPADERFTIYRCLDNLVEDGILESNKKYNYKLRNVSDADELLEEIIN